MHEAFFYIPLVSKRVLPLGTRRRGGFPSCLRGFNAVPAHHWLSGLPDAAHTKTDNAAGVLSRSCGGIAYRRPTNELFVDHFRTICHCAVARPRVLDWPVRGISPPMSDSLRANLGRPAGAVRLDGPGIFPQRAVLPSLFLAECRLRVFSELCAAHL